MGCRSHACKNKHGQWIFCDGLASAGACGREKPTGCLTKTQILWSGTAYRLTHVCLETCRENADDDDDVVVKGALLILIIQTGILQMYVLCALSVMTFSDIGTDCSNFSL